MRRSQQGPNSVKTTQKTFLWLTGAFLLVVLGVAMLYGSFTQIKKTADERTHIALVISSAENLLSGLKDAETGQRGYLLTQDESFLEPYFSVRDNLKNRLDKLNQLTQISSAKHHLTPVVALVEQKMAVLARSIEFIRQHDTGAAL